MLSVAICGAGGITGDRKITLVSFKLDNRQLAGADVALQLATLLTAIDLGNVLGGRPLVEPLVAHRPGKCPWMPKTRNRKRHLVLSPIPTSPR